MELRDRELLARYMRQRDFTHAWLARRAGCSRQFIWQLTHGKRHTCTPEVAQRIEKALGVPEGLLFRARQPTHPTDPETTRKETAA